MTQGIVPAWQQRVLDEHNDLLDKRRKLHAFMFSDGFAKLSPFQRELLGKQNVAMAEYSKILNERIATFPPESLSTISTNPIEGERS